MGKFDMLMSPIKIGSLVFRNRITAAPASLAFYDGNGRLTPECAAFFELKAKGGAACVTIGESIPEIGSGRSHPEQIPLDDPDVSVGLTNTADAIHLHGAVASIELSHGGAMCPSALLNGNAPIGPSAMINPSGDAVREMTEDDMFRLAEKYAAAARLIKDCGYDMLMIHGGHGWLLHQFLSELTNHRKDSYGGSIENRARFPLMIVDSVRKAVGPNFPIEFRMSGAELCPGGYGLETSVPFAEMLAEKVDLLHISAGTKGDDYSNILMHPTNYQAHGANLRYAAEIKRHVNIPVAAVGGFSVPEEMERVLEEGQADIISMARGLLADPELPNKLAAGNRGEIISCIRCLECTGSMARNRTVRCALNPDIGRESRVLAGANRSGRKKRVLVIGGGPGGMQAAIEAADLGHQVTLAEAGPKLGGMILHSEGLPFKAAMLAYKETLTKKIGNRDIEVLLNTKMTCADAEAFGADVIIAAIGSLPITPNIPGTDRAHVIQALDWTVDTPVGEKVVIIGGGLVGSEIGIYLGRQGKQVSVVEQRRELVMDCSLFQRTAQLHELAETVTACYGVSCTKIDDHGVHGTTSNGENVFYPADTVILAVGMRPAASQAEGYRSCAKEFYPIGDCTRVRKIMDAVWDAHCAVRRMAETP